MRFMKCLAATVVAAVLVTLAANGQPPPGAQPKGFKAKGKAQNTNSEQLIDDLKLTDAQQKVAVAPGDFNGDGKLDFVTTYVDGIGSGAVVWLNTSCSSGPNLTIARTGPGLTLSWPFPSAGYVLESSTSLNPANWKPADLLEVNKNGQWEVTTPTTQSQGYFRLRKP